MNKILEGMARCFEIASDKGTYDVEAMRGALLWLSKNVSDEMCAAALRTTPENLRAYKEAPALCLMIDTQRHDISAALRAAAEGEK